MTQRSTRHAAELRALAAIVIVLALAIAVVASVRFVASQPIAVVPSSSPSAGPVDAAGGYLGSLGPGDRLDGAPGFIARGSGSRAYEFDVAGGPRRLRVALDMSNRDDCLTLRLFDPQGVELAPPSHDYPTVCPNSGRSGQVFDVELSGTDPPAGRWRAVVDTTDVAELSLRLRVSFDAPPATQAGQDLYPDLVPWLPWEFGFSAPASDTPGTANDRVNGPGDPAVSCHPVEEPSDHRCLRFSAGVYNVGAGPLYVAFRGDDAFQHVYEQDATPLTFADNESQGGFTEQPAGSGDWHEFHRHRHLADLVLYELFEVTGQSGELTPVDTGHKHGYCTFSQQIQDWSSTAQDPQYASFPAGTFCDDAMTLERGWGDIYRWQRPGQYVSYESIAEADGSMRAGRYVLRFTVDPANHIAEADETNNIGYALIAIADGGGLGQDTVVVCEQGMGRDPWDTSRRIVADRFEWAKLAADPGYVAPACP